MTLKLIFPIIVLTLTSCNFLSSDNWDKIKKTGSLYPEDTIETFKTTLLQDTQTVWINSSYKNYPYKKICGNNVQVTFDLVQPVVQEYLKQDSLMIAHMLLNKFRETGVSHFVAQTIFNDKLSVYLYTEDGLNPVKTLVDFEVPNEGRLEGDEEWKTYSNLFEKK